MKLNNSKIKSMISEGIPRQISDGGGLNLKINKSGSAHWRLSYRFDNKQKSYTIGSYPKISLAQARNKRDELKTMIRKGKDPIIKKIIKTSKVTLLDASKEWFDLSSPKWSDVHKKEVWNSLEKNIFNHLGHREIESIKTHELIFVLKKIEKRGALEQLSKIRGRIEKIFIFSKINGYLENNPSEGLSTVLQSPTIKNYNSIILGDLPELVSSINDADILPTTKAGLKIALHTFLRTSEIRFAKWEEIDFDQKIWIVPAERMKMNRDHIVPLSPQSIKILIDLKEFTFEYDFIFAMNSNPKKPMSENAMLYALYRLGFHGRMTVHGFRHLASTTLNEMGFAPHLIEKQLSHENKNKVAATYNKAQYLPERTKMMNEWSSFVESYEGNVIPINFKNSN